MWPFFFLIRKLFDKKTEEIAKTRANKKFSKHNKITDLTSYILMNKTR